MLGVNLGPGSRTGAIVEPTLAFTGGFAGPVTVTVFARPTTLVPAVLVPCSRTGPSLLTRPTLLAPFAPPGTLALPMLAPFTWPATFVLLMLAPLTRPATLALTRPATFGWMVGMRGAMLRLGERMKLCASAAVPAKQINTDTAAASAPRRAQ